jgi:hypothetical protein
LYAQDCAEMGAIATLILAGPRLVSKPGPAALASIQTPRAHSSPQSRVNSQPTADFRCLDSVQPIFTTTELWFTTSATSDEGVHTNQVECLWSLLQPWLAKFCGLSKQGLEQVARTFRFLRSLNLVRAPVHSLIDCVTVNAFR